MHKWTSLVSTVFLLLLCLTGLPLIFHHEIDEALGYAPKMDVHVPGAPKLSLDAIGRAAITDHPGSVLLYMAWDKDEPGMVSTFTNTSVTSDPQTSVVKAFDAYTAKPVGLLGTGPMLVMLRLHTDMYLGLPGKWFMGVMGFLFMIAIISGVVLYWPFTRRLNFAAIRKQKSRRVLWLDWHNLLGVVTIVWALVVGGTGVINAYAEVMLGIWQRNELAAMAAPYAGKPTPTQLASLDKVVGNAMKTTPGMDPAFIAFPGTPFTSTHHFAVFLRGDTPLTSRLVKPVLLDGETGEVSDTSELPTYLKAVLVSQPLHFGDYGGMPLKIIWALLTVFTIIVLGSGLYLWAVKRSKVRRGARLSAGATAAFGRSS
ncbi:PepSY-associated TM helix domain-containing protein [Tardiphaga sp. 42S5]|uniref:PepSY-associated TM helix domain-containing protein n=1 Tax=Tardiphaga sp. 42S5 TaxID=1404799 RepID=UPI002A5A5107|nr:PepSY-associated TM helix domain-containing protein [Tardiphaga sp. 42S5]WPO44457.1 PepSY-associated TM helix domain-containing protein [Tardiphaga sp. 42S5]